MRQSLDETLVRNKIKLTSYMSPEQERAFVAKVIVGVAAVVLIIVAAFTSFGTVAAGERGVKTRFGAVVGIVPQGLYLKMPFIESVEKMDVQTQSLIASDEAPLHAASNDLQDTRLSVVVNYHIDPSTVADIYQQYGDADKYYNQVVNPLVVATVKATASQYTAAEQVQKRAEMAEKALVALQLAFDGKNVVIEKADITNVVFSPEFTKSIEAKVTAVQNAETQKNYLEQVKYEAQQTIEKAKAQAESIRIQASAINAQGGADYVQLQAIKQWNGILPQQMIPGSTVPFVNLKN